jgi:hypothetical protein
MNIEDFIWLPVVADKIEGKHGVLPEEAEEIFFNRPRFRFVNQGTEKVIMCIRRQVKQMRAAT